MPSATLDTLEDAGPETLGSSRIVLRSPRLRPASSETAEQAAHRLLAWLADTARVPARMTLIATGFMPVTLIAASAFGVAGLRALALGLLAPAVGLSVFDLARRPALARRAVIALGCGVLSTAFYDAYRFAFLGLGLMHRDPIPHIGLALGLQPAWGFGYLWRYLGNGGGLAVAFVALGFRGVRAGICYGLFLCAGLLFTLVAAPYGQAMLFPLNAVTIVMAVGGHMIYGAVLGRLSLRMHP